MSSGRPLQSRSYWLSFSALLLAFVLLHTSASADMGDPVPRVECRPGFIATSFAEGLSSPDGLALSPDGVLYVAEETAGRVSRIESYGSVTPVLSGLREPEGIAFDDSGNLLVVEDVPTGRLIKMTMEGITTTLATDRDAPEGVVWGSDGTVYITIEPVQADRSHPRAIILFIVSALDPGPR